MTLQRICVPAIGAGFLFWSACQDALPGNQYDPRTNVADQARGEIRGTVLLDATNTTADEIDALVIRLLDAGGGERAAARCQADDTAAASTSCDPAAHTAGFSFGGVPAGRYLVEIDVPVRFPPIPLARVELVPGEVLDLGTLRSTAYDTSDPTQYWTGRVVGVAQLASGQGGARRITLITNNGGQLQVVATAYTDGSDGFTFDKVPPGTYGVSAELDDFTPDYQVGFEIDGPDVPTDQNTETLTGNRALNLHPVTAVLIPDLQQTFGHYYTSASTAPVQVLQFGGMNEMRLSADPNFGGGADNWSTYSASTNVTLPAVEGEVPVYAQFRNSTVPGFVFTSAVYQTVVVHDTVAPTIDGVRVRGLSTADDGQIWINQAGATLGLEIDISDQTSALYELAVHHAADNGPGDPAALTYRLIEAPVGLVRTDQAVTLTGGEGVKRLFVYAKDRAGNLSEASDTLMWVDTVAPLVDALVVNSGAPVTGVAQVPVAIAASDLNAVVAMQVWEEGTATPSPSAFQAATQLLLQPLDYAHASRQINAIVWDIAGNASLVAARTLTFDDRGTLHGTLVVEAASDGSTGDVSGVSATVNGVSRPVQFTADAHPGMFDFVVSEVPAASNLQLSMAKAGYTSAAAPSLVTAFAGGAVEVGVLRLNAARGSIDGYAQAAGESVQTGISVEVQGTGLVAVTGVDGYFRIDGVLASRSYTLVIRKDDQWSVETLTDVNVPAGDVVSVSTLAAPLLLTRLAGSFAIEEGTYTRQPAITLLVSYQDAVEFRASELPDLSDASYATFSVQGCLARSGGSWACPFVLTDSDSLHHVYVQFRDPGSNGFESDSRNDGIILDRIAPTNLRFEINDGAAYSSTLSVTLGLNGYDVNGVTQFQLAQRQTSVAGDLVEGDWSGVRPLPGGPFGEVLPGSTGFRTVRVWARLIDVAGNISAPALASFVLDTAGPTGGSIVINGGASVTSSFTVTLGLTAADQSPVEMLFGDDRVPTSGTWEPFASSRVWVVPPATQGTKTVCVAFRDLAGNRTQDYCDDIGYDSIAPATPAMTTGAGTDTSDPQIALNFGNRTADVAQIEVATNAGFANSSIYPSQAQVQFTLPDPDGPKVVYARYIDAAGNRSNLAALTVTLDRQAPQLASLRVSAGSYTRVNRVQLELGALGASEMQISASANCSAGGWQDYAADGFVDVADPDGGKDISVRFRDTAGNLTSCLTTQVTLDKAAPVLGSTPIRLSGLQIVLNSGQSAVDATYVRVDFTVTGAGDMKISNQDGCADVNWQTFAAITPSWRLLPNDGTRTVYALFRDTAGNTTSQVSADIVVDSTGDVTGTIALEGSSDYNSLTFKLEERAFSHTMAANRFTLANVLTKTYVPLRVSKIGYDDALLSSGVAVPAGGSVDVGTITLRRSRGTVEGYVRLSDRTTHESTLVELLNTGYSTQTNSAGYFIIEDVLVGSYDLVARRDGYTTETVPSVAVQSQLTTQVSTLASPLLLSPQLGDFTINGGISLYTTTPAVTLNLSYADAVSYRASEDSTFGGGLQAYALFADALCVTGTSTIDCPFAVTSNDGAKIVYVQFMDSASQASTVFESRITLDTTPPAVGTVLVNAGDSDTGSRDLDVAVSSSDSNGVSKMRVSTDGSSWDPERSFQTPFTYQLSPLVTDGTRCVFVQFKDAAGLWSALPAASDCITLDRVAPVAGSPALVIRDAVGSSLNGGLTRSADVFLAVSASGASEMMFSNRQNFAGAVWQAYDAGQVHFWTLVPGDGARTVYVAYRDVAGNVVGDGGTLNASTTVDSVAPDAPVFTVSQGVYSNSWTINLTFSNFSSGDTVLFESNRALGQVQSQGAAAGLTFTLPDVDGLHLLTLRYRDAAGNSSASSTASITLDRSAPTVLALAIDSGASYSTSDSGLVMLTLGGNDALSGVSRMRFSNDGSSWAAWQSYGQSYGPWSLANPSAQDDVVKTVYLQLQDGAGNTTAASNTTIHLDNVHPVATAVQINSNQSHTASTAVTLTLVSSGASEMKISNGQGCSNGSWEAVAATRSWTLDGDGDGVQKYVSAQLRDGAGNLSSCIEDSIIVDTTVPSLPTVSLDSGALYNNSAGHTLQVTVSSVNASEFRISEAADFGVGAASWRSYPPSGAVAYTLVATGDGEKTIHAQFRDSAGNTTAVVADSILHDTAAPNGGYVLIDNGAGYTRASDGRVVLYLGASDALSGVATVQLSNDNATFTSYDYATVISNWALASPSSVDGATRTVYARFIDRAGNSATAVTDTIVLDNVAPQSVTVTVAGGATYTNSRSISVTVASASSDVTEVALSNSALTCSTAAYGANTGTFAWALAGSDGPKTIYVCARDAAGNATSSSGSITLDTARPSITTFNIDNGAGYTTNASGLVTLRYYATDSGSAIATVYADNDGTFSSQQALTFSAGTNPNVRASWALSSGQGTKTVYVKFIDGAGNEQIQSASITLDSVAPENCTITLADNAGASAQYTRVTGVKALLTAVGAQEVCLDGALAVPPSPDCSSASSNGWQAYGDVKNINLLTGDGSKTIRAYFRDSARNVTSTSGGNPIQDAIVLDSAAPSIGSLTLTGRAAESGLDSLYSRDSTVVASIADSDASPSSSLVSMVLWEETSTTCGVESELWQQHELATSFALSATEGSKYVCAKVKDAAGNESLPVVASIVLDTAAPELPLMLVGDTVGDRLEQYTRSRLIDVIFRGVDPAGSGLYQYVMSRERPPTGGWTGAANYPNSALPGCDAPGKLCDYDLVDAVTATCRHFEVMLTEIDLAGRRIELYNALPTTVDLTGWTVDCYVGATPTTVALSTGIMAAGAYSSANVTCAWTSAGAGAARLKNGYGQEVDFVRWNSSTVTSSRSDGWGGSLTCSTANSCGRSSLGFDRNLASDWCLQTASLGSANGSACSLTSAACVEINGYRHLWAKIRDRAGNETAAEDSLYLDLEPATGWFQINSGALYTNNVNATITATGQDFHSGLDDMLLTTSATGVAPSMWAPFTQLSGYPLPGPDGVQKIFMAVRDVAGSEDPIYLSSQAITLDRVGPNTCSVAWVFPATPSRQAGNGLTISSTDAVMGTPSQMMLSENSGFSGASWETYVTTRPWTYSTGDGAKTVYAMFKDAAGNASSSCNTTTITVDTTAPTAGNLTLNGGASPINSTAVSIAVSGGDVSYLVSLYGSITPVTYWYGADQDGAGGYAAFPATITLNNANGLNVVNATFIDRAGNASAVFSAAVTVDTNTPASGTVVLANGATSVNSRTIDVTISRTQPDTMYFWEVGPAAACGTYACNYAGFEPFTSNTTFTLSTGQGDKRVCWRFCDLAGNGSGVGQQNIILGTYLNRPTPILASFSVSPARPIEPASYTALSRESFSPKYPITIYGRGFASDTLALIGDFSLPCVSSGSGNCQTDVGGGCGVGGQCEADCAESCLVILPDEIMRNAASYVVRMQTGEPVEGSGTSSTVAYFTVVAPQPVITKLSPRGVFQSVDGNGPVAQNLTVEVWGRDFLYNAQYQLATNYATVLDFQEIDAHSRYVRVQVSTDGLWPKDKQDYTFSVINPSPGGGEDVRPFGINPHSTGCEHSFACTSNLRWTKTSLPAGDGVYQRYGYPSQPNNGLLWKGATALAIRRPTGSTTFELMMRLPWENSGGASPLLPFNPAKYELEDALGAHLPVVLNQSVTGSTTVSPYRGTGTFGSSLTYTLGALVEHAVFGDLNNDGKLDLIGVNSDDSTITVRRNSGSTGRSFTLVGDWATGTTPKGAALGDLNGDGNLDIVTANYDAASVSLFLGDGNYGFGLRQDLSMVSYASKVVIADLNNDGASDLVVGSFTFGSSLVYRLGRGDGTFESAVTMSTMLRNEPVVRDFNYDGFLDLVQVNGNSMKVALNNGGTSFVAPTTIALNLANAIAAAAADVDEDGDLDIVVADSTSSAAGNISVYSGNGSGGFAWLANYAMGAQCFSVVLGDFSGDGHIDAACANYNSSTNTVSLRLGAGDGTFGAETTLTAGDTPRKLWLGDIDGDGVFDLACANLRANSVTIFWGDRGVLLGRDFRDDASLAGWDVAIGEFNKDGFGDVVVSAGGAVTADAKIGFGQATSPFLNFGSVTPASTVTLAANIRQFAVADLNANGDADLIYPDYGGNQVSVRTGLGDGSFNAATSYAAPAASSPRGVAVGDLNGDRFPDIVLANYATNNISVWRSNGAGGFLARVDVAAGTGPNAVALADLDRDGDLDVLVAHQGTSEVRTFRNAAGTLTALQTIAVGGILVLDSADIDRDGDNDLVVGSFTGSVFSYFNNGSGTLSAGTSYSVGNVGGVRLAEINGDGYPDLLAAADTSTIGQPNETKVLLNDRSGGFGAVADAFVYDNGVTSRGLDAADLNSDGAVDFVVGDTDATSVIARYGGAAGGWSQELNDMPAATLAIVPAVGLTQTIHQTGQYAQTIGVRVRLSGADYNGLTLTFSAPGGQSSALSTASCVAGTPCVLVQKGFATMQTRWQPTGNWTLTAAKSSGAAIQLVDFAVFTHGWLGHQPGYRPELPDVLPMATGATGMVVRGSNLGYADLMDASGNLRASEGAGSGDHWYEFTMPAARTVTIAVVGAFDTVLALDPGACTGYALSTFNDNVSGSNMNSVLASQALTAQTYCLVVGGQDSDGVNEGRFDLSMTFSSALP